SETWVSQARPHSQSKLLSEVRPRHRSPPRPVVITLVAPHIHLVADSARAHDRRHLAAVVPAHVPLAGREHRPDMVIAPAIVALRQVVGWIVEVHIFAVPPVEE